MAGSWLGVFWREGRPRRICAGAAFVCAMCLALFVRLYRIGGEGFHGDEIITLAWLRGEPTFSAALGGVRQCDPPMTPIYFLVQYAWVHTVGFTLLRLHLLSVLFSAATFVVVFFIGRRLKGALTGLAAMFLLAVSPIHIFYSLEIRNYSLTALLGALSLYTLLRGVEHPTGRLWVMNFWVDALLGMSHLFANLLFVPQAIFLLTCHRRRAVLLPWFVSHAVITAVVSVWLGTCDFAAIRNASSYIAPLSWGGCYEMLVALTGASYSWAGSALIGRTGVMGGIAVALFLLGLFALLAEWLLSRMPSREKVVRSNSSGATHGVFLLVLTVILPPAILAIATQGGIHCFLARYAICSAVAAPILLACAVTIPRSRTVRMFLATALVLTNVSLLGQVLHTRPQRSHWRPIYGFLHDAVKPWDYLVLLPPYADQPVTEIEMVAQVSPKRTMHKTTWSQSDFEDLAAWHARGIQVWLVNRLVESVNARFESSLNAFDLPFRKQTFKSDVPLGEVGVVLYCVPADSSTFAVPDCAVTHVPLGSADLRGWFAADPLDKAAGIGMTHLVSNEHPFAPVFTSPSLSLRSVMEGIPAKTWLPWDAPRTESMELSLSSPVCADVRWSLHSPTDTMDCRLRYVFSSKNAVDILFEVTPRSGQDCTGPLVFSFMSRVNGACSPAIHFPGIRDGVKGWVSFGERPSERGVVDGVGPPRQEREEGAATEGLCPVRGVGFSEPVYYGLVDGDQNDATSDDAMAFVLMFEHPEDTRFVLRDLDDAFPSVAWDWQYVLRAPEPDRTYCQRVRMVYKPFLGEDDVLAEYHAWRDAPPTTDGLTGDRRISVPVLLGPGQEECNLAALAYSVAEMDPKRALDTYTALLEVPLYRLAAAEGIDACFMRFGDQADLAAKWESVAARDKLDALPWVRLGAVRRRMGDTGKAVEAFAQGLERDPLSQECSMGLVTVLFDRGNIRDAARSASMAVDQNPQLAQQAADLCVDAALARLSVGDPMGAETACRAALQFAAKDARLKLLLGRLLAGRGETENGLALLGEVIAANPDMTESVVEVCSAITEMCGKTGNVPSAATVLRRAIACPPDKPNCRMALGQALEAAGDDEGALAEYLAAMTGSPESQVCSARIETVLERRGDRVARVDIWQRLVDACPTAAIPQAHLSLAMEAVGNLAAAETVCQTTLKRDPGNAPAKIQMGKLCAIRGDIEGGLVLIKEAVSARPELAGGAAGACAAAANSRLEAGDSAGAELVLKHARSLVPDTCQYAVTQAGILRVLGDIAGAEAAYREALKCDPGDFLAKIQLGTLLVAGGDVSGGRVMINEAVSAAPRNAGQAAEACAVAARRSVQAGDVSGAVTAFRQALSLTPNVLGYRADLAVALETVGDSAAALSEYRAVVEAAPESPKSSARIDAILDGSGEKTARVELWKNMVAGHPDAAIPQLHLGLALEASGDGAGARTAFEKALTTNPALAEARDALGRLDNAAGNGKQ